MTTKNTTALQLQSLDAYMDALGYERSAFSYGYELKYPVKSGEKFIRLNTAVMLYNYSWDLRLNGKYSCNYLSFLLELDSYSYTKAEARKIVDQVFLQCTKHQKLITQKHQVRFVNSDYYDLFLGGSED